MALTQLVRAALDHQSLTETSADMDGYRVEEGLGDVAFVRWGHGEPFRSLHTVHGKNGLPACASALRREGFRVVSQEFEDGDGIYILVAERL
jgi:hypothetical protein